MIKPRCHLEKLSTIFPDDDFHYDAMVIFNSKSTNDTRLVMEMLENLEGVDNHLQLIKLVMLVRKIYQTKLIRYQMLSIILIL